MPQMHFRSRGHFLWNNPPGAVRVQVNGMENTLVVHHLCPIISVGSFFSPHSG